MNYSTLSLRFFHSNSCIELQDSDPIFTSNFWSCLFKFSGTLLCMRTVFIPIESFLDIVCDALAEYKYVRPNQRANLALACRIREWKESVTVLLCDTSGCGKSTLSALLSSMLGITTVVSTDSIRHMMRSLVDEEFVHIHPFLTPLAIISSRTIIETNQQLHQVWVHWNCRPPDDSTWKHWEETKITYNQSYKLELPSYSKIHRVFHCSFFKPYLVPIPPADHTLPLESLDNHPLLPSLAILDYRTIAVNDLHLQQILVQWNGLPPDDNTWEKWQDVKAIYRMLYLGTIPPENSQLPPDSVDNHPLLTLLAILDSCTITVNDKPLQQGLVQWDGLLPDDTTWEIWTDIQASYNLEDKVGFDEEGIDMTPLVQHSPCYAHTQDNTLHQAKGVHGLQMFPLLLYESA